MRSGLSKSMNTQQCVAKLMFLKFLFPVTNLIKSIFLYLVALLAKVTILIKFYASQLIDFYRAVVTNLFTR